LKVCLTF